MTETKANVPIHPKDFSGPKGLGFLKYVPGLIRNPLATLIKISNRFGKIIPFTFAGEELYFINDPGIIQHILKTNYINYQRRNTLLDILPFLGNGIFASEHKYWVEQRKILNAAFHSKMLENYIPEVQKQVSELIVTWEKNANRGEPVDIQHEMKILMFGILVKSMLSENVNYDSTSIIDSLDLILQHASIKNHTVKVIRKNLFETIGIPKQKDEKFLNEIKKLDDFVYKMIEDGINGKIKVCGILGTLIEEFNEGRTDKIKIRDEIMNFLFAGFDTVAETLTWAFYSIAVNPIVGEKLRKELYEKLNGNNPDFSNVNNLTYTKRIIDETLRLYPAAWAFFRITATDDVYENLEIPARSYLMICPYTLHRNPKIWDEPELFNPERFESMNIPDLPMMGYIPFGDGPHICIGKKLAILQAQIILGMISQKFKFHLISKRKPEIIPGIIMKAKNKIRLRLELI
jgi:cytochrome P450